MEEPIYPQCWLSKLKTNTRQKKLDFRTCRKICRIGQDFLNICTNFHPIFCQIWREEIWVANVKFWEAGHVGNLVFGLVKTQKWVSKLKSSPIIVLSLGLRPGSWIATAITKVMISIMLVTSAISFIQL